jgi:hypothetical protein
VRPARTGEGWITFSVFGLVVMATWTLVIKFLAPLLYFASQRAEGHPMAGVPVMWDFWWVAHLALARLLWRRHPWAWACGVVVSVSEVCVVVVKFFLYLGAPDFSFWRLLWFTNKLYVLAFFIFLTVLLFRPGVRSLLREGGTSSRGENLEKAS